MKSLHSEIVIARYRLSYRIFHRSLVSKLFLAIFLKQFCLLWSRFSISLAKFESSWTITLVKALNYEFRSISKWTSSVKIFYYFSDHGVCSNRIHSCSIIVFNEIRKTLQTSNGIVPLFKFCWSNFLQSTKTLNLKPI